MPTRFPDVTADLDADEDPRLDTDFYRAVPGTGDEHDAILVGVVHDHPASSHRVRRVARALEPDALALELPPLAVPAFERAATAESAQFDCDEMSAAIAAAPESAVVGVDSLGPRFGRHFLRNAVDTGASVRTLRRAAGGVGRIARHAVRCRLDAAETDDSAAEAVTEGMAARTPAEQAADERTQVARSRSLLGAIERPRADRLLDATREDTMADGIARLRRDGTVLGVLGLSHLDTVADAVANGTE
ncbi:MULTISPECIES: hypothetical protein [Salinibaculum]|uniref:hypothetical protein n=1 Tax=Salinibaculum TaxID=2732368 RepID=UPI0030D4BC6D